MHIGSTHGNPSIGGVAQELRKVATDASDKTEPRCNHLWISAQKFCNPYMFSVTFSSTRLGAGRCVPGERFATEIVSDTRI